MTRQFVALRNFTSLAPLALLLATAGPGSAQNYPSRPVKLVVPYAAGGTSDVITRIIADRLSIALGQSMVVENRPGATGAIGAKAVANAAPDGHTLLAGNTGEIAINPHWAKGVGYNPDKDFLPVALGGNVPLALVVPGKAPYATVAEMLKGANERGLSFASAGAATPGYFAGEILRFKTKSNLTHVPYNGATPALNDLLGGHVDLFFSGFPPAMPHVQAGALKLIAVSSGKRTGVAPDVPTVAEAAGIAGFDITLWQGFFAPRGTPLEVVARLNAEINKILVEPAIKQKLLELGADVSPMSIDQFASFVKSEGEKYRAIIKDANLTPG
jgi:tripartite-type tricarboxylate transporter receptor subunit TctC